MFLNHGVGEDSWESLGLQGDLKGVLNEISPEYSLEGLMLKLKLQCFGHLMQRTDSLEKPWCWERLKAGKESDDRGWDGWKASVTQWTWAWVHHLTQRTSSGSWWRTEKTGVLQSMRLQNDRHYWATELIWTDLSILLWYITFFDLHRLNHACIPGIKLSWLIVVYDPFNMLLI